MDLSPKTCKEYGRTFWIRDVIAQQIVEELEAALEHFRAISDDLRGNG